VPVRLEFHQIPHPFKLCIECNSALGDQVITLDPGHPKSRQLHCCRDCFGATLHQIGDGIMRMIENIEEQEKGDE
jgi:hypothetical protein